MPFNVEEFQFATDSVLVAGEMFYDINGSGFNRADLRWAFTGITSLPSVTFRIYQKWDTTWDLIHSVHRQGIDLNLEPVALVKKLSPGSTSGVYIGVPVHADLLRVSITPSNTPSASARYSLWLRLGVATLPPINFI